MAFIRTSNYLFKHTPVVRKTVNVADCVSFMLLFPGYNPDFVQQISK